VAGKIAVFDKTESLGEGERGREKESERGKEGERRGGREGEKERERGRD